MHVKQAQKNKRRKIPYISWGKNKYFYFDDPPNNVCTEQKLIKTLMTFTMLTYILLKK